MGVSVTWCQWLWGQRHCEAVLSVEQDTGSALGTRLRASPTFGVAIAGRGSSLVPGAAGSLGSDGAARQEVLRVSASAVAPGAWLSLSPRDLPRRRARESAWGLDGRALGRAPGAPPGAPGWAAGPSTAGSRCFAA